MLMQKMCPRDGAVPKDIAVKRPSIISRGRSALARIFSHDDLNMEQWRRLEFRTRKPINPNPWR